VLSSKRSNDLYGTKNDLGGRVGKRPKKKMIGEGYGSGSY